MASKDKPGKPQPIQSPKGMHDILPQDQHVWAKVRKSAEAIAEFYNFGRLDTPIMESAEIFERSLGEPTDVVEKQMYTVSSGSSKERLVLRPEATAPIARAYIQNSLSQLGQPVKLFFEGPIFRHEQPQAGRFREFHQVDYEIVSNDDDPIYDAQIILAACRFLEDLKLKNLEVAINSIGCKNCRPAYRKELQSYYKDLVKDMCSDCARRLELNPLRLLDCKQEKCQKFKEDAPIIIDHLCQHCHNHFKSVLSYLDELALPYRLDHHLVRGFDYYSKTVFEILTPGDASALCGGGRYDYLIEFLGGRSSPAVGCALGIERIIEAMAKNNVLPKPKAKTKVFLVHIGELAKRKSLKLIEELRESGIDIVESLARESLKSQLRAADKYGSPFAIIFGQKEVYEESVIVRDLKTGLQESVPIKKLGEVIRKKLK